MRCVVITSGIVSHIGKHSLALYIGALLNHYGYKPTLCYINPNHSSFSYDYNRHILQDGTVVREEIGLFEKLWKKNFTKDNIMNLSTIIHELDATAKKTKGSLSLFKEGIQIAKKRIERIPKLTNEICIVVMEGLIENNDNFFWVQVLRELYRQNTLSFWLHTCLLTKLQSNVYTNRNVCENLRLLQKQQINIDSLVLRCNEAVNTDTLQLIQDDSYINKSQIYVSHNMSNAYEIPIHFFQQQLPHYILKKLKCSMGYSNKVVQKFNKFVNFAKDQKIPVKTIGILRLNEETIKIDKNLTECIRHSIIGSKINVRFKCVSVNKLSMKNDEIVRKYLNEFDGFLFNCHVNENDVNDFIRIIRLIRTMNKSMLSYGKAHAIIIREIMSFFNQLNIGLPIESQGVNIVVNPRREMKTTAKRSILRNIYKTRDLEVLNECDVICNPEELQQLVKNHKSLFQIDTEYDKCEAIQYKPSPFFYSISHIPTLTSRLFASEKLIYMWLKNTK